MYDLLLPLSVLGVSFTTPEDKDILLIHIIFCCHFSYQSFQNTRAERQYIIYKFNAWEDVDQEQEHGHQEGGPEYCDVDKDVDQEQDVDQNVDEDVDQEQEHGHKEWCW